MITYKEITPNTTAVFIKGKRTGTIQKRTVDEQFQYWPWGDMQEGGDKFPTLALCKKALEAD